MPIAEPSVRPIPRTIRRRSARWITGALCLIVVLPVVITEIPREQARWYLAVSAARLDRRDIAGALQALDQAIDLDPQEITFRLEQARIHFALQKHEQAFEYLDVAEKVAAPQRRHTVYQNRAEMYLQLHRWREAAEEISKCRPRANELAGRKRADLLNSIAYLNALANVELDAALRDINEGLDALPDDANMMALRSMMLDTRGYVYYRRGEHQKALDDLNTAISQHESLYEKELAALLEQRYGRLHPTPVLAQIRNWQRGSAVMYYHRLQVYRALGLSDTKRFMAAAKDFLKITQLGFAANDDLF